MLWGSRFVSEKVVGPWGQRLVGVRMLECRSWKDRGGERMGYLRSYLWRVALGVISELQPWV